MYSSFICKKVVNISLSILFRNTFFAFLTFKDSRKYLTYIFFNLTRYNTRYRSMRDSIYYRRRCDAASFSFVKNHCFLNFPVKLYLPSMLHPSLDIPYAELRSVQHISSLAKTPKNPTSTEPKPCRDLGPLYRPRSCRVRVARAYCI